MPKRKVHNTVQPKFGVAFGGRSRKTVWKIGVLSLLVLFLSLPVSFSYAGTESRTAGEENGATDMEGGASEAAASTSKYLISTPQITNILFPLQHATYLEENRTLRVRAAVISVADPLETRLGRAFDVQLSSLIRAFHSKSFVLDSFAMTWKPWPAGSTVEKKDILDEGTIDFKENQRSRPSVLVFRKDLWRSPGDSNNKPVVDYRVIFLVGESPTFGLHPKAFKVAAECAVYLNSYFDQTPQGYLSKPCYVEKNLDDSTKADCNKLNCVSKSDYAEVSKKKLQVIGPAFSGSMQSLAAAIGRMLNVDSSLNVNVVSPTASVYSNQYWTGSSRHGTQANNKISYISLAASLWDQLQELCIYSEENIVEKNKYPWPNRKVKQEDEYKIVIFAEESTFGRGVSGLVNEWLKEADPYKPYKSARLEKTNFNTLTDNEMEICFKRIQVIQFPQNVSAIRAEHSLADREQSESWLTLLQLRKRLLELDFSGFDQSTDRPPAYLHKISSRSDELMLYHLFDSIRVWVQPVVVAIVATDVRDRLFMLNEVRKSLPSALPVLLEMDYLTAHPDYRKISRGSLVIPNGPTLLCLDNKTWDLIACIPSKKNFIDNNKRIDENINNGSEPKKAYFPFPADYAANMFRAVHCLIRQQSEPVDHLVACPSIETLLNPLQDSSERVTMPRVTTLAGFQTHEGRGQSSLLAADSRLTLQWIFPVMLIFATVPLLLIAIRLRTTQDGNLVMVSLLEGSSSWRSLESDLVEDNENIAPASRATWINWILSILMAMLLVLCAIEIYEAWLLFFSSKRNPIHWSLAHGRDLRALWGLFLWYLCIAILGGWRLYCLIQRFDWQYKSLDPQAPVKQDKLRQFKWVVLAAIPVLIVFFSLIVWFGNGRHLPTTVDSPWLPLIMNCTLLALGIVFMAQFYCQARNWLGLSAHLACTMHVVNEIRAEQAPPGSQSPRWPSPMLLGQNMQSPFGLKFRTKDLAQFDSGIRNERWAELTRNIIAQKSQIVDYSCEEFLQWQARLVAEMRYASAAVRSAAWCGILAPVVLLVSLNVYPPVGERFVTTASVALIAAGFALVMYMALRIEQNPLLSRMFTQHDDQLSFGGVVGALWPKLLAAMLILLPVLFPGILEWIYSLLKSINSL